MKFQIKMESNKKGKTYGEFYGKERAKEIKEKMSKSHLGKKFSKEHKKRLKESHKGFFGKKHSKEMREQARQRMLGKNNPFYGKHHSKEVIEKIRNSKLGKPNPKCSETKKRLFKEGKLINNFKGKHHTKKTKRLIRLVKLGKKNPKVSETRKKLFKDGKLIPLLKGKTYEEVFGEERAKEIKLKHSKNHHNVDGENNPNWMGGLSFEPYTKEFNNKFKRAIRKRDNYICLKCGIHQEKLSKALAVHHINYDKTLTIPENCCSLCNKCHNEVGYNREHWVKFFQSLLSKKYGYKYSNDNKIILEIQNARG